MKNLSILLFLLIAIGCVDPQEIDEMDVKLIENIPVTANTRNAFSYVISANDFSQQTNLLLNFDSSSFVVAIVIGGYAQGELSLALYNEDSSQTYRQRVTSSMVFADFPTFKPTALELGLEEFSGSVDLAVSVQ
jgi:hypothetical protein